MAVLKLGEVETGLVGPDLSSGSPCWPGMQSAGADLPWRRTNDPYAILVPETMLQQTGVERVIPKYQAFLERFPTCERPG